MLVECGLGRAWCFLPGTLEIGIREPEAGGLKSLH
jgi:hypothetical protein